MEDSVSMLLARGRDLTSEVLDEAVKTFSTALECAGAPFKKKSV